MLSDRTLTRLGVAFLVVGAVVAAVSVAVGVGCKSYRYDVERSEQSNPYIEDPVGFSNLSERQQATFRRALGEGRAGSEVVLPASVRYRGETYVVEAIIGHCSPVDRVAGLALIGSVVCIVAGVLGLSRARD